MSGNRVEELEAKVKDLEATVEGLTDELVECKVRLRELENAVDDDIGFSQSVNVERESMGEHDDASAEADKNQGADVPDDAETESDIIIA